MMSPAQQCGSGPGGFPFFSPHISNPYHDQVQLNPIKAGGSKSM